MKRPTDQCPTRLHATGELFPSDKEEDGHARGHLFLFSSFILLIFYLFTMIVTRALLLEVIKGEAGATSKEIKNTGENHGNNI
jgi:hypothetical protein